MHAAAIVFLFVLSPALTALAAQIPVQGLECVSALTRGGLGAADGLPVEYFTQLRVLGREIIATQRDGQIQFHTITPVPSSAGSVSEYALAALHSDLYDEFSIPPPPQRILVVAKTGTVVVKSAGKNEILFARVLQDDSLELVASKATLEKGVKVLDLDQTGELLLVVNAENSEVSLRSVHSPQVKIRTWDLASALGGLGRSNQHQLDARFAWDEDRMVVIIGSARDLGPVQVFRANRDLDVLEYVGAAELRYPGRDASHELTRSADGSELYFTDHRVALGAPPGQILQRVDFHVGLSERIKSFTPPKEQDFTTQAERAGYLAEIMFRDTFRREYAASLEERRRKQKNPVRKALKRVMRFLTPPSDPQENEFTPRQDWEEITLSRLNQGDTAERFAVSVDRSLAAMAWWPTSSLTIVDLITGKTLGAMNFAGQRFPTAIEFSEDGRTVYLGIPQTQTAMPNGGLEDTGRIAAVRRWTLR